MIALKLTQKFGIEIISQMKRDCDSYAERYDLNYSLLATPAEGLSGKFTKVDRRDYGTILGVTDAKSNHGSFAGVVIGFTLVLIHILGIGLTGTSVNPARSLGPAIVAAINGNSDPISCVWVFIIAPFIGAAIAACVHNYLNSADKSAK